jgi:hypothetical protein
LAWWAQPLVYVAAAALGASALVQLRNLVLAARFCRAALARYAPAAGGSMHDAADR